MRLASLIGAYVASERRSKRAETAKSRKRCDVSKRMPEINAKSQFRSLLAYRIGVEFSGPCAVKAKRIESRALRTVHDIPPPLSCINQSLWEAY